MTSVPYPTFEHSRPSFSAAVGRCRIYPNCYANDDDSIAAAFEAIVKKCHQQGSIVTETDPSNKKLAKKYMKESVAMAHRYLTDTLSLDVSVVDVEVVLQASDVVATTGCLAACFLDAGCARIVLPPDRDAIEAARIPSERLVLHMSKVDNESSLAQQVLRVVEEYQGECAAVSVRVSSEDPAATGNGDDDNDTLVALLGTATESVSIVLQVPSSLTADRVGALSRSTRSETVTTTISLIDPTPHDLGLAYAACCKTDRPDGLYTTVVCTRSGEALGLVYSSKDSIVAALECGRGVYYSRSRQGLWRKGDTSGHYQTLHRIDVDCDGDALRFTVTQRTATKDESPAFCHLKTLTCWGAPRGVRHLEETLAARLQSAPEGSYTKRLFEDETLLQEKLVEEAQELSEADTPQHVAEELADVLYFAMVRAAKAGVSIDDAAAELDRRTRKVTRRKGDSKSFRIAAGNAILDKAKEQQK